MKRLRLGCLLISILFLYTAGASLARSQTPVPKADTQSWNDIQLAIPLNKKVDFTIQGTIRIGGNLTTPVDERWGFGAAFKLNKYLTVTPFYFHRYARPPNGKAELEERATLGATLRFPIGKFTLSERNWVEHRWRDPQVDAWRYRNAVLLEHPFKIGKTKFTFAIGDEVFYDWSVHDWVRNRFQAGASHVFNKHLTLYVYGMRQNDGRSRPGDINIIGTQWRFRL
jgi:Protein of unknown function (DUF2490)